MNGFRTSDIPEIVERLFDAVMELSGKFVKLTGTCGFVGRYCMKAFAALNDGVLDDPVRKTALDNMITTDKEGHRFSATRVSISENMA